MDLLFSKLQITVLVVLEKSRKDCYILVLVRCDSVISLKTVDGTI